MPTTFRFSLTRLAVVLLAAAAIGGAILRPDAFARLRFVASGATRHDRSTMESTRSEASTMTRAALVPGEPESLQVPEEVAGSLGLRTARASRPTRAQRLEMVGTLAIDPNRLAHVHTRFVGEVVELGMIENPAGAESTSVGPPTHRPIQYGDRVEKGQVLAVLWSSELGEKKSAFVDALSRHRLERETLTRLEVLYRDQVVPERSLREARRDVEAAEIAVASAERTLRVLRVNDQEIAAIRDEAEALRNGKSGRDHRVERDWARVELRAPLAGTVLEKNLVVGDIVDTALDLFKIASLDPLAVWAHAYEEDLAVLQNLPAPIPWSVRLKSDPAERLTAGAIERVGDIIDPTQHTALVMGRVDNPDQRLKAGQFVVATVDLPLPDVVEIPIDALVEDGRESVVFVQPDPARGRYSQRHVEVVRRFDDRAFIRGLNRSSAGAGPTAPPRAGELVVASGAIELRAALERLQAASRQAAASR